MRTILLTGANGFIGHHLLAYIRDTPTYAADRIVLLTSQPVPGYECIVRHDYQLTSLDLVSLGITRVDVFLHLGGFIPKEAAQANEPVLCTSNITVTLACLEALPLPLPHIVFISTIDIYDIRAEYITEETALSPVSLYGWSKLYTEHLVQQWAYSHQAVCQILRLGHIYGPGEEAYQKLIPRTIRLLRAGESPIIYTDGSELRAFLHVTDCCRLVMKAIELPVFVGPINVASNQSLSVLELVTLLKELTGSEQTLEVRNSVQDKRSMAFDNAKMQHWLGVETVDLRSGLAQEIAAFNY